MIGSGSFKAPSLNQSEANSFFARRIYFTALCTGHVCFLCIIIDWFPVLVRLDRSTTLGNLFSNFLPSGYFALKSAPEFIPVMFSNVFVPGQFDSIAFLKIRCLLVRNRSNTFN